MSAIDFNIGDVVDIAKLIPQFDRLRLVSQWKVVSIDRRGYKSTDITLTGSGRDVTVGVCAYATSSYECVIRIGDDGGVVSFKRWMEVIKER